MVQVRSRAVAITALALVATATVGTAALAQSPSGGESPAASAAVSMAPIVPISGSVVVIPKQINNPYFDVAFKGAQSAAAVYGGDVTQVGPSAADATQQIPFIQTATTQGAKAILISADDATAIAPALQQAMTAGIKVVG
jgi:rhamnose transport system substrate-binding protein